MYRRALRILLPALAAGTLAAGSWTAAGITVSGIAVPERNSKRRMIDSFPTFWEPRNSKFPIQHAQQRSRRPTFVDRLFQTHGSA
ncbi:hypothetical protein F5883DRAFT_531792 [Diaporthe sp. PMI_573]|nr:hypothetical protein F5883DRAFT_531792 [Diaporthaceae sp. PMI_573]